MSCNISLNLGPAPFNWIEFTNLNKELLQSTISEIKVSMKKEKKNVQKTNSELCFASY